MEHGIVSAETFSESDYNPRFLEFLRLFLAINDDGKLFPKECRTCGRTFTSLANYLWSTVAKVHCLEDAEPIMGRPFTMTYRHCGCGNTLVLTFTDETYPLLGALWAMLRQEAEQRGRPLKEVVRDFAEQWHLFMVRHGGVSGLGG
jgi:hypothetical protein